ncbi:hypothetical protein HY483_02005, partial [Candidatus Woesearchaeota archaeon]|nr:hypothetical protein [Candidatus Woesearchaeota archaeon]
LFIFEGNARKETEAIKQLKDRCISLKLYGNKYKKRKIFDEFTNIRIFWYSMKKKTIVEYTDKGEKVSTQKFDDIKMLISKIQKI